LAASRNYDESRRPVVDLEEDSLEELKAQRPAQSISADPDEPEAAQGLQPPGADLSDEEMTIEVVPMLADEFRCSRCFLVRHRSQLAGHRQGQDICQECV
jgi:hypothetical protein